MLKKKEAKAKKSIAETLLRDMQGSAAEKFALFEKLRARGGFAGEDRRELVKVENMLRTFAAMEKNECCGCSCSLVACSLPLLDPREPMLLMDSGALARGTSRSRGQTYGRPVGMTSPATTTATGLCTLSR